MGMIRKGHFLLPWFQMPDPFEQPLDLSYYEAVIKWASRWNLPISLLSTQWERYLTDSPQYFSLPRDKNPNVVNNKGAIEKKVSPFGPIKPWTEIGKKWGSTQTLRKIQSWYQEPPLVLFISNNEHARLTWSDVEKSSRYLNSYGLGRDDNFKRQVVGDGWKDRYRALQKGMLNGLTSNAWKDVSKFMGYEAFGTSAFGRWDGWIDYSLYKPGRFEPWPQTWDGGSVSYYVHNWDASTDYTVWSPQIQAMNWVFMLEETKRLNKEFRFEMSTWDGHEEGSINDKREYYTDKGQLYGPERYQGMVQFGMWLLRPRVVREYRSWMDTLEKSEQYFLSVVNSVDRVHTDPVLRRFWRKGVLVVNPNGSHPFMSKVPKEYKDAPRWFLLDADANLAKCGTPPDYRNLYAELKVFSLALVIGKAPEREWLVYAHSPLKKRAGVEITLPGYGPLQVDVTPSGCFYHVIEKAGSVQRLSNFRTRRAATSNVGLERS
ncbi:MAG: hypothetical protein AB9866_25135 [Syntrophobacteraceae bacterium]